MYGHFHQVKKSQQKTNLLDSFCIKIGEGEGIFLEDRGYKARDDFATLCCPICMDIFVVSLRVPIELHKKMKESLGGFA